MVDRLSFLGDPTKVPRLPTTLVAFDAAFEFALPHPGLRLEQWDQRLQACFIEPDGDWLVILHRPVVNDWPLMQSITDFTWQSHDRISHLTSRLQLGDEPRPAAFR